MKHCVARVPMASTAVYVTWPLFVKSDLPALVVEQRSNVSGRDEVGRIASVSLRLFDVNVGVMDHEEMTSTANSG